MLKNLLSKFRLRTSLEQAVVTDFSHLSAADIVSRYDESCATLQRYVDFAWDELQKPRPAFGALHDEAMSIEISHKLFMKYYGDYLGLVKELERCGIHRKSLSSRVEGIIERVARSANG